MTSKIQFFAGARSIDFITYPSNCKVKIILNGLEVIKFSDSQGMLSYALKEPLKTEDYIVIVIEKNGWKTNSDFYSVN